MSISFYKQDSSISMDCANKFSPYRKNRFEKVKKTLFGPLDHDETEQFISAHLKIDLDNACQRWNFNFETEKVLDGNWIWSSSSPIKVHRKRKIETVNDSCNSLYFQPIDPVNQNSASSIICKPQPNVSSLTLKANKKQSLITDFMQQSKTSPIHKKESSSERPKKIPKLGDCSS